MATELENKLQLILDDKNTNLLPENLKAGVTCLGINGTMESGVDTSDATAKAKDIIQGKTAYTSDGKTEGTLYAAKLFQTQEEMNNDSTIELNDLACVYGEYGSNLAVNSIFQTVKFPETVTLDAELTKTINFGNYLETVDGSMFDIMQGMLTTSSFNLMAYTDTGDINIRYNSSDGITYNRSSFYVNGMTPENDEVDFGTELKVVRWDDALNKFFVMGGKAFYGIYQAKNSSVDNIYNTLVEMNSTEVTYEEQNWMDFVNLMSEVNMIRIPDSTYPIVQAVVCRDKTTKLIEIYASYLSSFSLYTTGANIELRFNTTTSNTSDFPNSIATIKFKEDNTYTCEKTSPVYNEYVTVASDFANKEILGLFVNISDGWFKDNILQGTVGNMTVYQNDASSFDTDFKNIPIPHYSPAETQFTLSSASELPKDIIAYGKPGVITGDGTIENVTDVRVLLKNTCGVDLLKSNMIVSGKYAGLNKGETMSITDKEALDYTSGVSIMESIDDKISDDVRTMLNGDDCTISAYNDDYIVIHKWTSQSIMDIVLLDRDFTILDTKTVTYGTVPSVANKEYYTKPETKIVYNSTTSEYFVILNYFDNITNTDLSSSRRGSHKFTVYKIENNTLTQLTNTTVSNSVNYYDEIHWDVIETIDGIGVVIFSYTKTSNNFMCYGVSSSGTVTTKSLLAPYVDYSASIGYGGFNLAESSTNGYTLVGGITWDKGLKCIKISKTDLTLTTIDISSYLGEDPKQPYVLNTAGNCYLYATTGLYKFNDTALAKIVERRPGATSLHLAKYDEVTDTGFYSTGEDISYTNKIFENVLSSVRDYYDIGYSDARLYGSYTLDNRVEQGLGFIIIDGIKTYVHVYVTFDKKIVNEETTPYKYVRMNDAECYARITYSL